MPNYDQTGPNGQGPTGRRGQIGQNGNQNATPGQDNSLLTSLRRCLRRGNAGDGGQGQNRGRSQGNKGGGRGGNNGNCRYRNNG